MQVVFADSFIYVFESIISKDFNLFYPQARFVPPALWVLHKDLLQFSLSSLLRLCCNTPETLVGAYKTFYMNYSVELQFE